jgi:hypothetical protein
MPVLRYDARLALGAENTERAVDHLDLNLGINFTLQFGSFSDVQGNSCIFLIYPAFFATHMIAG